MSVEAVEKLVERRTPLRERYYKIKKELTAVKERIKYIYDPTSEHMQKLQTRSEQLTTEIVNVEIELAELNAQLQFCGSSYQNKQFAREFMEEAEHQLSKATFHRIRDAALDNYFSKMGVKTK